MIYLKLNGILFALRIPIAPAVSSDEKCLKEECKFVLYGFKKIDFFRIVSKFWSLLIFFGSAVWGELIKLETSPLLDITNSVNR